MNGVSFFCAKTLFANEVTGIGEPLLGWVPIRHSAFSCDLSAMMVRFIGIVNAWSPIFMTMGDRLKEERLRLGVSQTVLAEKCGVTKNTQLGYEKGERSPDGAYFAVAVGLGIDLLYVVTGERMPEAAEAFTAEEANLLRLYRGLSVDDRNATARMITGLASLPPRK